MSMIYWVVFIFSLKHLKKRHMRKREVYSSAAQYTNNVQYTMFSEGLAKFLLNSTGIIMCETAVIFASFTPLRSTPLQPGL